MCAAFNLRTRCTTAACRSGNGALGDGDRAGGPAAVAFDAVAFERLIGEGASCSGGEGLGAEATPDRTGF